MITSEPEPPETVRAVFFDADGVLQQAAPGCFERLGHLAGPAESTDELLTEIFAAERPTLVGRLGFRDALEEILARRDAQHDLDLALEAWVDIDVDPLALNLVDELRNNGVRCFVASNQNDLRADHMSRRLGYAERFDGELYSCHLGVAKPDLRFFRMALDHAGVPAEVALFVDDSAENVRSAVAVGMTALPVDVTAPSDVWQRIVRDRCMDGASEA